MWSFFGKMQHDVQHAKSSPSIKRDIYNCENRFSETENLLLNNKTNIDEIGTYDIPPGGSSELINIPYSTSHKFLYISYGLKNNSQAYGGGTVVIYIGEHKPCFLPVYNQNAALVGVIYIYNDANNNRILSYTLNAEETMLLKASAFG